MSTRTDPAIRLRASHQVQLLQGGEAYFNALEQAFDRSTHEIRLETYIFHLDVSGQRIAAALERAATRGVRVYLAMDGFGTPGLAPEWSARFTQSGVHWRIFSPLGRWGIFLPRQWRRLHRKLCVVDGAVAFCGGINILDDFVDPNHGALQEPRLDFAVQVSGPLVRDIARLMVRFWWRALLANDARNREFLTAWRRLRRVMRRGAAAGLLGGEDSVFMDSQQGVAPSGMGARAALVLRDNLRNRTRIERMYLKALGEAREEVVIANAYFLPGGRMRRALVHAARRGVRVRLLLQGRYEYFLQFHATRRVYGVLLDAGVEIHEYAPSFLHAKVAVIDQHWATVGSANIDPLSMLLAREANVLVEDVAFAGELHGCLEQAIASGGRRVEAQAYAGRSWRLRMMELMALACMRLGLFLIGRRY